MMFNPWSIVLKFLNSSPRCGVGVMPILLVGFFTFSSFTPQEILNPSRSPASYIPDDDIVPRPVDNSLSFYERFVVSDNGEEVIQSRNQLKIWNDNQQFADHYGLDTRLAGSAFYVPTPEEKFEYFKERYMRYLRRKGEQPFKDMPKNWYQEYRVSNEVDTIDEMEARFKKSNRKSSVSGNHLPESFREREISVWKKTKFIFQPRLDQGLVLVGMRGPIAYARAWVGVNGETELNIQKQFDSIGFRVMYNHYIQSGKYFTSIDQRITQNLYARLTSQRQDSSKANDETYMLLYTTRF